MTTKNIPPQELHSNNAGLNVNFEITPGVFEVAEHIAKSEIYQKTIADFKKMIEKGIAFDGEVLMPINLKEEFGATTIQCQGAKYSVSRGINAYNAQTGSENIPILPLALQQTGGLGIDTMVIGSDEKVIIGQRSPTLGKWPDHWFCGFGEGLDRADVGVINNGGIRCMKEELDFDLPQVNKQNLKVISLAREESNVCWTAYAVLDLRGKGPEYSSDAILRRANSATDLKEANHFLTMEMKDVPDFLSKKESVPATVVFINYIKNQLEIKHNLNEEFSKRITNKLIGIRAKKSEVEHAPN